MDKEMLLAPRAHTPSGFREEDVEVPAGVVRVRGLSRLEALSVQEVRGTAATERRIVSLGLVDPVLTEDEVEEWQRVSEPDEIEPVSTRIAQLSGLLGAAPKAAYKEFEATPDAEFPVLPSGETGNDGAPDARRDEQ